MRKALGTIVLAVGLLVLGIVPAAADDAWVEVIQPKGLTQETQDALSATVDWLGVDVVTLHSGSFDLLSVERPVSWARVVGGQRVAVRHRHPVQAAPEGYTYPMSALALDPAEARGHWSDSLVEALQPGMVAMSTRSAALRGARVGDLADLRGLDGVVREFVIGAVVDDEEMAWYEIAMSTEQAVEMGLDRPIAAVLYGDVPTIEYTLPYFLPDQILRVVNWRTPPRPDDVLATVRVKERFGEFAYRPVGRSGGMSIEDAWVEENIVWADLPRIGEFRCHKAIVEPLGAALDEVYARGLSFHINASDFQRFGGCYNPRLIRGDTGNRPSRHSWGIAVDINPSANPYGGIVTMPIEIGEIFRSHGFAWGGGWTYPDGGHFEWNVPLGG